MADERAPESGETVDLEQRALRYSVWGNLFFALLGLGFAASSESQAILLDGFFSLIAWVMSLLTIRVARLIQRPADRWFHFGYAAFEPLLNTVKGLLMLGVCAFALAAAIGALVRGGRPIHVGWALAYSVVAGLGAALLTVLQGRAARKTGSPLLAVDAQNWRIDAVLSAAVGLAFLAAFLLREGRWSELLPYVDPVLVIALVLLLVRRPLSIVKGSVGELLALAPEESVQLAVKERFAGLIADLPVEDFTLRMLKTGRSRYLLAHVVLAPGTAPRGVEELDTVRRRVEAGIREMHPTWEVDTVFVADTTLARGSLPTSR